jgi:hypothetical protein
MMALSTQCTRGLVIISGGDSGWLGTTVEQRLGNPEVWDLLGFRPLLDSGLSQRPPYPFRLSPMPFWVFALTPTAGRLPGTWVRRGRAHLRARRVPEPLLRTTSSPASSLHPEHR